MEPKETRIKQTLDSIDGIGHAKANPFLYDKVMNRMQTSSEQRFTLKHATVRFAIAFAALLIGLNVFSLVKYNKTETNQKTSTNSFNTEYFSYLNNY